MTKTCSRTFTIMIMCNRSISLVSTVHPQRLQREGLILGTEVRVASVIERVIRALTGCVHRPQQIAEPYLTELEIDFM